MSTLFQNRLLLVGCLSLFSFAPSGAWAHSTYPGPTNFWFLDAADQGCDDKGQSCSGMAVWSVSEPFINLWVKDEPVGYTTSLGEHMGFRVAFKQRDTRPPAGSKHQKWYLYACDSQSGCSAAETEINLPAPKVYVPPTGWNHSWFSYIRFAGQYHLGDTNKNNIFTNAWQDFSSWKATLYLAGGGAIDFVAGTGFAEGDYPNVARRTGLQLYAMNGTDANVYPATTNGTTFVPCGGLNVPGQVGFRLVHADGSLDLYGKVTPLYGSSAVADALLTEHHDPYGNITRYYYTNWVVDGLSRYFLNHVVDYDGNTNRLTYNSSNLVSRVDVPYGRCATFDYDTSGRLTNIVDAAGMSSKMFYSGTNVEPSVLHTPYGNTTFEITDAGDTESGIQVGDAGGTNRVCRSIRIAHPNGSKELYLYRFNAQQVGIPETIGGGSTPTSPIGGLDTASVSNALSGIWRRNSFHWSRRQHELLSTNAVAALTTNDFKVATMTHWLALTDKFLGTEPALIREGSPDGTQTGAMVWYGYSGKAAEHRMGDGAQTAVCQLLPEGNTRYKLISLAEDGEIESVTLTGEDPNGGGVTTRSFNYYYENLTGSESCTVGGEVISSTSWPLTKLAQITGPAAETLVALSASADESVNWTNVPGGASYEYTLTRPQRRTLTVTDAENRTANVWFNARQQVQGVAGFNRALSTNFYDANGWLARTINLSAAATNSLVYTNGLLSGRTNPLGLVTRLEWDNLERLQSVRFRDDTGYTNVYEKLHVSFFHDRRGNFTQFQHDPFGQLTNVTEALSRTTQYAYCSCGALETVTDPVLGATTYGYNYNGRLTSTTDSDSFARNFVLNSIGQVTNVTDTAGNWWEILYNHQGLVRQVNNRTGMVFAVVYDLLDRAIYETNAFGAVATETYDHLNRLLTHSLANGALTHTETRSYLATGLDSLTDAEGRVTRFGYDPAGRLNAVTNANLEVVSATFNPLGEILSLTDGRNQTKHWAYNVEGRPVAETNALGLLARTNAYDANGNLTKLWTPAKGLKTFHHDALGNLTNVVSSNYNLVATYDPLGRWTNLTDAAGTLRRSYVKFGAFKGALATDDGVWANDTFTVHRELDRRPDYATLEELDAGGNTTTRTWTFNYDGLNRLQQLGGPAGTFTFDYLGPVRRLGVTHLPGGNVISNVFDPAGQLLERRLQNAGGTTLDGYGYTHDLTGLRTNIARADGTHAGYAFDGIGQLTNAVAREAGGGLRRNEDFSYSYDAAGNLATRINHTLTQTFGVNDANRLSSATRSGPLTVAGLANSLTASVTVNGQATELYADQTFATTSGLTLVDGANELRFTATDATNHSTTITQVFHLPATVSFTYDANGNLTSDGALGYEFDDDDQLTSLTATNAWRSEFGYDALGRRVVRREYGWSAAGGNWQLTDEVRYVWRGMQVMQERDAANRVRVTYTGNLAREDANGAAYYFTDGNRNVSSLIDASGNVKARYRYDSFGNLLAQSGPLTEANTHRFSGKEYHNRSGLYYYGYRYYAPNLQRWLNEDPIGEHGGLNLYGFVGNDSVNGFDSFGLCLEDSLKGLDTALDKMEAGLGAMDRAMDRLDHFVDPGGAAVRDQVGSWVDGARQWLEDSARAVGQSLYDLAMDGLEGEREWHRNQYTKGALDAEAGIVGIDPHDNVLRNFMGDLAAAGAVTAERGAEALLLKRMAEIPGAGRAKCPVAPPGAKGANVQPRFGTEKKNSLGEYNPETGKISYNRENIRAEAEFKGVSWRLELYKTGYHEGGHNLLRPLNNSVRDAFGLERIPYFQWKAWAWVEERLVEGYGQIGGTLRYLSR